MKSTISKETMHQQPSNIIFSIQISSKRIWFWSHINQYQLTIITNGVQRLSYIHAYNKVKNKQTNKNATLWDSCDRWIRKAKFARAQWDTDRSALTSSNHSTFPFCFISSQRTWGKQTNPKKPTNKHFKLPGWRKKHILFWLLSWNSVPQFLHEFLYGFFFFVCFSKRYHKK